MPLDKILRDRFRFQLTFFAKELGGKKKVLHRDIKPENILLNSKGQTKLTDFGISRDLNSTVAMAATFVGTATYMSPERALGQDYSYASDIWSLGMVIYEMATLRPPFRAEDMDGLYKKVIKGVYPKLPSHFSVDLNN